MRNAKHSPNTPEPAWTGRAEVDESAPAPLPKLMSPAMPGTDDLLPYLRRIEASGVYSNYGPLSEELRARLGQLTKAPGVAMTSSGTTALELALRACVQGGSGSCLMPDYTFVATAHAVANAGLDPVFLDIDETTLSLTPAIAQRALNRLDVRPAAVVVVSAFGAPVDFAAWSDFEELHGIPVVFDAAAALSTISGVPKSPVCVSLHATKLPGAGEAGAVLIDDPAFADRVTAMTGFGFKGAARESSIRGGNYRISEYTAAVALAAMDLLPRHRDRLLQVGGAYRQALHGKSTAIPQGFAVDWVSSTMNVRLPEDQVDATIRRLEDRGIPWRRWWGLGCHVHPAFETVPTIDLKATPSVARTVIGLPFHVRLVKTQIEKVADCLP